MNEHEHQCLVMVWAAQRIEQEPDLELLFAIANAGAGAHRGQAGKMKAEGVKPGVPDLCWPVARGGYFGLYIEMKDEDGSPSPIQREWIERLKEQGYYVTLAHGKDVAIQIILSYSQFGPTRVITEEIWGSLVAVPIPRPMRCWRWVGIMPPKRCTLSREHEGKCSPEVRYAQK